MYNFYSKTTTFQHITITQNHKEEIDFYINGHLQFSSRDEFIYHEFLVHPVTSISKNRKNILVLGGGDGLAIRELLKYPDTETITLVDIDREVTRISREFEPIVHLNEGSLAHSKLSIQKSDGISPGEKITLKMHGHGFFRRQKSIPNQQIHVFNIDAFKFVRAISGIFDIIVIDFPDPNNLSLSKLYSLEFYSLLKKRLSFDGLIIQQSTSPTFAKETFLVIGRTMKAAGFSTIPIHHNIPSFGDWGWWIAGHYERYGNTGLKDKLAKPSEIPENVRYITNELIQASLIFGKTSLRTSQTDINTILEDKAFYYYRNSWESLQ